MALRGESTVEVKAGDAVTAVVMDWKVENYVAVSEKKEVKKAPAKRTDSKGTTAKKKTPAKKRFSLFAQQLYY